MEDLFDLYEKSNNQIQIYDESLESSRSNVRSLQDRPIILDENSLPYDPDVRLKSTLSIEEKLKGSIHGKLQDLDSDRKDDMQYNIEFPLKLLLAFLEDLRVLRMESKTKKAWVDIAENLILDLQHDMDRILKTANRVRWLLYLGNWTARGQIKKWYNFYDRMLWSLVSSKSYRFTFKFVRRDTSKSVNHSPKIRQTRTFSTQAITTDDMGISSLLSGFGKKLEQEKGMDEFKKLARNFKRVHNSLMEMETEAVEGVPHSRKAWTDQLSTIFEDAEKSFNAYGESKPSDWSENPNKTDSRSKIKDEVDRFDSALYLLLTCIRVFLIELGEENNWVVSLEKDIHDVVSGLITYSENRSTYFIVGMKGIGKTTLANTVYYHREIQKHFEFRCWVPVDDIVDEAKNVLQEKLGKLASSCD